MIKLSDRQAVKLYQRLQGLIKLLEMLKLLMNDNVDIINKNEASIFMSFTKELMIKEIYIGIIAIIKDQKVKMALGDYYEKVKGHYADIRNKHFAHIVQDFDHTQSVAPTIGMIEDDFKKILVAINSISNQTRLVSPYLISNYHTRSLKKIIQLIDADNKVQSS